MEGWESTGVEIDYVAQSDRSGFAFDWRIRGGEGTVDDPVVSVERGGVSVERYDQS